MADRYLRMMQTPLGMWLAKRLGLPVPPRLLRHTPGTPVVSGPVWLCRPAPGPAGELATKTLAAVAAEVVDVPDEGARLAAGIFDMSGMLGAEELSELWPALRTSVRALGRNGRIIVLGTAPDSLENVRARTAHRALEGLVRSLAKELRAGSTAQLLESTPGAEAGLAAPLRFFLSPRSAFVSGQRLTVGPVAGELPDSPSDLDRPLAGQVALVTGAARGIGAAVLQTLARDGATVVGADLPAAGESLTEIVNAVKGTALQVDITSPEAPARIADFLRERHRRVDLVVHNAGVTRDKTMAGMDAARWDAVLDINLLAQERIDAALHEGVLSDGGRIVSVSSMSGIAGNRGQTNYAASKAGVMGRVEALAEAMAHRGGSINAVAPGFIETEMTGRMPFGPRELGRRISSLGQGGRPVDVAEAIGFFAWPDAAWVNGTTLRVCGQNLLGA